LLLADAQTSGGLLLNGEIAGAPVIGRLLAREPGRALITVLA
jgi:selenide,water dikinase